MSTQIASEESRPRVRRSARVLAVRALGPTTTLAGIAWALAQPYRITLLHPHGQGFWWLFAVPPLLVALVGLLFHFLVVPGLLRDLGEEE